MTEDRAAFDVRAASMCYETAKNELRQAYERLAELHRAASRLTQDAEDIKAEKWLNGEISGSNEATRKASLTVALAQDSTYVTVSEELADTGREIEQSEGALKEAEADLRGNRIRIEHATAELYYQAALRGGHKEIRT